MFMDVVPQSVKNKKTQGRGASCVGLLSLIDLRFELSCVHESFIHSFILFIHCLARWQGCQVLCLFLTEWQPAEERLVGRCLQPRVTNTVEVQLGGCP